MKKITLTLLSLFFAIACYGQGNIIGKWKTIDDETGEAKSVVEIFENNGQYFGQIVKLFRKPHEDPDPICDKCPQNDARYNKKVIGMEIIRDMKKVEDEYIDGTVLKPDEGKIYKCKIWIEGQELKIRGYWGLFYRTQTWLPYE